MALVNKLSAHQGSCYLFFWDLLWYKNLGVVLPGAGTYGIYLGFFFLFVFLLKIFGLCLVESDLYFRSLFFFCGFFFLGFFLMVSPHFFHFSFFGVGLIHLFLLVLC